MGDVKDLSHSAAIQKLKKLATDANICHFVTALDSHPLHSRPMATQDVNDEGLMYFFSKEGSDKNTDIEKDDNVQLFYANGSSYEYLSVYGKAEIIKDVELAKKLWTPVAKAWFTEGPEDPALTIIKVMPEDAYYWDTKNNKLISLIKIAAGAITGKTSDDGVKGKLDI